MDCYYVLYLLSVFLTKISLVWPSQTNVYITLKFYI